MRITFDRGKLLAALISVYGGYRKIWSTVQGGPYRHSAGTSDKRGTVSEPFCFEGDPGAVALKGIRARYVLSILDAYGE